MDEWTALPILPEGRQAGRLLGKIKAGLFPGRLRLK